MKLNYSQNPHALGFWEVWLLRASGLHFSGAPYKARYSVREMLTPQKWTDIQYCLSLSKIEAVVKENIIFFI